MIKKWSIFFASVWMIQIVSATPLPSFGPCKTWKTVCAPKADCMRSEANKTASCFRCLKPTGFAFHAYAKRMDRMTCNVQTATYLRTMGYRCYHPRINAPCLTQTKQVCRSVCMAY